MCGCSPKCEPTCTCQVLNRTSRLPRWLPADIGRACTPAPHSNPCPTAPGQRGRRRAGPVLVQQHPPVALLRDRAVGRRRSEREDQAGPRPTRQRASDRWSGVGRGLESRHAGPRVHRQRRRPDRDQGRGRRSPAHAGHRGLAPPHSRSTRDRPHRRPPQRPHPCRQPDHRARPLRKEAFRPRRVHDGHNRCLTPTLAWCGCHIAANQLRAPGTTTLMMIGRGRALPSVRIRGGACE